MLRGTVYIMDINGVPRHRMVLSVAEAGLQVGLFRGFAITAAEWALLTGERLEFGPIGEPWRKV